MPLDDKSNVIEKSYKSAEQEGAGVEWTDLGNSFGSWFSNVMDWMKNDVGNAVKSFMEGAYLGLGIDTWSYIEWGTAGAIGIGIIAISTIVLGSRLTKSIVLILGALGFLGYISF